MTINLVNDYTGLTDIQGGTLFINTGNIGPSPVLVTGGTLKVGNGGALGDTSVGTTVNGGTLDINAHNLGAEAISVQGNGVGLPGIGAIVNNSTAQQQNALRFLTLTGDATIGGTARWDIRAIRRRP